MSDNNNYNKQYSAEDIQRYLNGTMSAEEMHRLEKQALEDPFLADAIEGMAVAQKENKEELVTTTLEDLKKEFSERIRTDRKVVSIHNFGWWKLAAAAMIVIIAGVFAYNTWLQPSAPDQLAKTETKVTDSFSQESASEKVSEKQTVLQASDSQVVARRDYGTKSTVQKTEQGPLPKATQVQSEAVKVTTQNDAAAAVASDDKIKTSKESDSDKKGVEKEKEIETALSGKAAGIQKQNARKTESETLAAPSAANRMDSKDQSVFNEYLRKNLAGRVIDRNNQPLANATVQVLNNRNAFLTDRNGNFNIPANDSVLDVQVGIVGYNTRNFQLRNNAAMNNVVLEQSNNALNEVIASNSDRSRQKNEGKTQYPAITVQNAVPVVGWIEYEKYLENNKQVNKSESFTGGEVIVSFQVSRNGALSNYKIEKSLTKEYDAEAIRLIKDGPAWKIIKGNRARATMIVKF